MNEFTWNFNGLTLTFASCVSLFSPTAVDRGTQKMIELADILRKAKKCTLPSLPTVAVKGQNEKQNAEIALSLYINDGDFVLDLGCGYGAVGIYFAKVLGAENVVMSDIDPVALEYAKKNAHSNGVGDVRIIESDGFNNIDMTGFTQILVNPPYHADFSVPKHFIEKGFNRLAIGGTMHMVTKRKDWYKNKFASIFGGVRVDASDGYFVFSAQKRRMKYAKG